MNDEIERRDAEVNTEKRTSPAPKLAASKAGRGKKIAHSLVVASAVAVMTVYSAGFAVTQSAASQLAAQATPTAAVVQTTSSTPSATAARTPFGRTSSAPSPTATAATTANTTASTSTYKDGTYTGTGTSRHGSITATVVVQNGRIASANITGSTTRYPTSRISTLPAKVVSTQSTKVNYVSGATDSSGAYLTAVANALAQAA